MKTLIIAALLGTSLFSANAHSLTANNTLESRKIAEKRDEASELKQKIDVQVYNLEMLKSQYRASQEAIKNTKGNHQEIDKDFEYFYSLLLKSEEKGENKNGMDKAIQQLKKEYAKKHKERASFELKEQKALAATMQNELNNYTRTYKSLQNKSKKLQPDSDDSSLQQFKDKLEEAENLMKDSTSACIQNATFYEHKFQSAKKI